jgi:hypothetical protein
MARRESRHATGQIGVRMVTGSTKRADLQATNNQTSR